MGVMIFWPNRASGQLQRCDRQQNACGRFARLARFNSRASVTDIFELMSSLDIPRQRCLNNLDFLSGDNRVGRIDDDLIIRP